LEGEMDRLVRTKTYISGDKLILPEPDLRGREGEYTITLYPFVATNGREIVAGYGYRVHELGYFKAVALSFEDLNVHHTKPF